MRLISIDHRQIINQFTNQSEKVTILYLLLIIIIAATGRLHNIDFGLPSLWDDDEPFFLMFGLKLLKNQAINPGWFGHPGTTTIYLIALTTAGTYGLGNLFGSWTGTHEFIAAIYGDPALIMVPQRVMIVIPSLISVWLTYRIGDRIYSARAGLLAAAILALSPLHIELSQLVRTDVQMTMWVMLSVYMALPLGDAYRQRALVGSSAVAGIACATKWPGALILLVPIALVLGREGLGIEKAWRIAVAVGTAIATLLLVSPYILLDYRTVLQNVLVEGRPRHLSQTSNGPADTLSSYVLEVLPAAMGWPVLLLAAIGLALVLTRRCSARLAIPIAIPVLTFLGLISAQSIMWPRWTLPMLPFLAIAAGAVLASASRRIAQHNGAASTATFLLGSVFLLLPVAVGAWNSGVERSNDTRDLALEWVSRNVPANSSIAVETPAIPLLKGPWPVRFPLGDLGCIDPRKAMTGQIEYDDVARATGDRININLSTVLPRRLSSCKADFIIVNELDRYVAEAAHYPDELANYRSLLAGMHQVATFAPSKGRFGGPTVRIFARPTTDRFEKRN